MEKLFGPPKWVRLGPSFLHFPKVRLELAGLGIEGSAYQLQFAILAVLPCPPQSGLSSWPTLGSPARLLFFRVAFLSHEFVLFWSHPVSRWQKLG